MRFLHRFVFGGAAAAGLFAAPIAGAQQAQEAVCPQEGFQPVLTVGDFNGDKIVDGADLKDPRITTGIAPETVATRCADQGGHAEHAPHEHPTHGGM